MSESIIPSIDAKVLFDSEHPQHQSVLSAVRSAATEVGFMTVYNTDISRRQVEDLLAMYRKFFLLPEAGKEAVDMAKTSSNRGWGSPVQSRCLQMPTPTTSRCLIVGQSCHLMIL